MGPLNENTALRQKAEVIQQFFVRKLSGFSVAYSGSSHYSNGHTGDLGGGYEFQFYFPKNQAIGKGSSQHRVRLHREFLDDRSIEVIIQTIERSGLIEKLKTAGKLTYEIGTNGEVIEVFE